jgi:hypothetical protein
MKSSPWYGHFNRRSLRTTKSKQENKNRRGCRRLGCRVTGNGRCYGLQHAAARHRRDCSPGHGKPRIDMCPRKVSLLIRLVYHRLSRVNGKAALLFPDTASWNRPPVSTMLLRRRALRNYEQSIGSRTNSYDQPVTIDFVLGEYNGDSLLAFSQAGLESIIKVGDDGTLKSTTSNSWLIWNCGHFWTSSYRRFAIQIKSLKGSALMATTIKTSFQEFASNLEITDRQTNLVSERRGNVG